MKLLTDVILVFLLLATPLALAQKDALLLHLPFDEGSGTTAIDMSGNGHDGVINGAAEWIDGKYGKALVFNGTDVFVEVELTPDLTFNAGDSFTAAVWINTTDAPNPQDGIFGDYRVSTTPFWGMILKTDGNVICYLRNGGSITITTTTPVNDGNWRHLAFIRDAENKKARLYVDGALIGEADDPTGDINSGQNIFLGEHLQRYLMAALDDAMLFNRPLTEAEIQTIMTQGVTAISPAGSVASTWGYIKKF
jgi:hypothetical protein